VKKPDENNSVDQEFEDDAAVLQASRRRTRRSFLLAAAAAAGGYGAFEWISNAGTREFLSRPLRDGFQVNARIARTVFDEKALAPTYPLSRSENLRTNGFIGLKETLVPASWRLQMVGVEAAQSRPQYVPDVTGWEYEYATDGHGMPEMMHKERAGKLPRGKEEAGQSATTFAAGTPGLLLAMDEITRLPKHDMVTQFKCIEGWSQIVHWSGYRMADFIDAFPPAKKPDGTLPRYVYMETPNGDYYVGYDLNVCRHPQTLLVTEMAGQPLEQLHGAPIRLHTPTKYGYKQIKRIGLMAYTDIKPDDYWTRLGYDWYAGL
jgi:hypothetical protein